jgi:hypothetical protein
MNDMFPACCICSAEAAWVRMRMPNGQQMNYLCDRHHAALSERNPLLAGYYDAVSAPKPMQRQHASLMQKDSVQSASEDYSRQRSTLT